MLNTKYIFKWWILHCHVSFFWGGVPWTWVCLWARSRGWSFSLYYIVYTCKLTSKWAISLSIEHMWVTLLLLFALYRCSLLCFLGTDLEWKQPSMYRRWLGWDFLEGYPPRIAPENRPSQEGVPTIHFQIFRGKRAVSFRVKEFLGAKKRQLGAIVTGWIFPFRRFSIYGDRIKCVQMQILNMQMGSLPSWTLHEIHIVEIYSDSRTAYLGSHRAITYVVQYFFQLHNMFIYRTMMLITKYEVLSCIFSNTHLFATVPQPTSMVPETLSELMKHPLSEVLRKPHLGVTLSANAFSHDQLLTGDRGGFVFFSGNGGPQGEKFGDTLF